MIVDEFLQLKVFQSVFLTLNKLAKCSARSFILQQLKFQAATVE